MTRHERLSLGVSAVALLISVVSPFANYFWFQSEVRIRELKSASFAATGFNHDCGQGLLLEIQLKNDSIWPIANVKLTIQKYVSSFDPNKGGKVLIFALEKRDIDSYPPLPISTADQRNNIVVRFTDPFPPKTEVTIGSFRVRNVPNEVREILPDVESMSPFVWLSSDVLSREVYWNFGAECSPVERSRMIGHL